jgi:hypothetical protein
MGSGFKNFVAGAVLLESDLDGYLMRQTVMTFASSAARDSALSGVLDEGMVTYQEDNDEVTYYTGAAWRVIYKPRTAHTPTGSGALTVGNGTFNVDYIRHGDAVTWGGSFTFGSTSAMGSGQAGLSLPVSAHTTALKFGQVLVFDASANTGYAAIGQMSGGAFTIFPFGSPAFSSTSPMTWTTSDSISWSITYIAA